MADSPAVNSAAVRQSLVEALWLDLIGPTCAGGCGFDVGDPKEVLPEAPSRWYLTGFLVPSESDPTQAVDPTEDDELEAAPAVAGIDDETVPDKPAARRARFPSSMGLSVLVPKAAKTLSVTARWGDYKRSTAEPPSEAGAKGRVREERWTRTPKSGDVAVPLGEVGKTVWTKEVPGSGGLRIAATVRTVPTDGSAGQLPAGTRSVSVFLVNHRRPAPDETRDEAFTFQAELEVTADAPFTPRPNTRGLASDDWDERLADLQYRDTFEYAVGHNVSTNVTCDDGSCRTVRTCWLPQAEVERVAPTQIEGVELSMDALALLRDAAAAREALGGFVATYKTWINGEAAKVPADPPRRGEMAKELLRRCEVAAGRIDAGIESLADPQALEAFRVANKVMAAAARRRLGVMQGKTEADVSPTWRPFQLAFLLMNLRGIADPTHADREVVDLLFFPTGGGKTEAYLGLAAFTLVLRRLRNPGIGSAGLAVLMRYTLRLLTLDQLGRAATLICALELERKNDVEKLGTWPFEIGLWVGQAATPNRMGDKTDKDDRTARARTIAYMNNSQKPSPIPLEDCPWCGEKFKAQSFRLVPNRDFPRDLRIGCLNRDCAFSKENELPIVTVDEPIYRRLPCFVIATVDKFAALPWTGEVGKFFGRADRYDERDGFYGPCDTESGKSLSGGRLLPPDLVIQDELHLISGPLGTIAGLYEAALDELCVREVGGKRVRPKVVASTATVRRAEAQIQALFDRKQVDVFPPPGPDRRDSFFAEVEPPEKAPARLYVGLAGLGRSAKVVMLRTYLALLAAAQKAYDRGKPTPDNPADPYMTLLGYFNSLRELGGARRLVEDEITNRLTRYAQRKRVGEAEGPFADRKIAYEVVELTSRIGTNKVSEAKRRLARPFSEKERVDLAIATNMISVGLDITRLGLMVVFGQPKASAEYIQATSRVGRDVSGRPADRPGLVVTILNPHKPRDRSHYERFAAYHESFYRAVEATSVTPYSPRAMDRALAAAAVALARHGDPAMTPAKGAAEILKERGKLAFVAEALARRAGDHAQLSADERAEIRERVRKRADRLLDVWDKIAAGLHQDGLELKYGDRPADAPRLLHHFLDGDLENKPREFRHFRANRSMRDVEPSVNLLVKTFDGRDLETDADD